ncbi:hypothetical protein TNCV_3743601 [Trichonephila clavipes]|nr:hypothetical protein TNCV_3743601 [Trichonephila clavipes]
MPSQWRYTPKKKCPVVKRKWAISSALSRCLGIGPKVARVSHGFPKLFVFGGHGSICVNVCGRAHTATTMCFCQVGIQSPTVVNRTSSEGIFLLIRKCSRPPLRLRLANQESVVVSTNHR